MNNLSEPKALTRRVLLGATFGAAAMTAIPAFALSTAEARQLVNSLVREINTVIASGKSESGMIRDFDRILGKYGDMPTIASQILGVPWRSASASERRGFTKALQGYLARKYGKQFRRFVGGEIEVQSARAVRSFFEVKSIARLRGEAPFEVVFLVSGRSGRDLFFNMIIEGINLRTTEAVEIGAILDQNRGSIPKLIQRLNQIG